jgi:hypothetical protein
MGFAPNCQVCGFQMRKTIKTTGRAMGCATALLMFAAGVVIFLVIPIIGWVIGGLLMLVSLFIGGKRTKVWQCRRCDAIVARG